MSDSNDTTLATFTIPANYSSSGNQSGTGGASWAPGGGGFGGSSVLITCPGLDNGSSYTLKLGSSSSSVTARQTGTGGNRPGGR